MTDPKTTIYKYEIPIEDKFHLDIPRDALLLHVDVQHGKPCLWFLVTPGNKTLRNRFVLVGTGHPAPYRYAVNPAVHLGTFMLNSGHLVLHLFRVDEGYDE